MLVSSIGGRAGLPGHGAYSLSKMPLTSLAQTLDAELHEAGILVGIIYVGFTRNDLQKTITDGNGTVSILKPRSGIRVSAPETVAARIVKQIRHRQRSKVLSFMGHLQTFFYQIPVIRRLIMKIMLKKYSGMYT